MLVSTEWLNNNLSKVKIFDASWHMPNSNRNSHKEYLHKHIPEAMFWDLDEHSDKDSPFPHMLPNSDYWTRMLWSFGIENDDHIIVYDFSDVHSACRLYFSLKYNISSWSKAILPFIAPPPTPIPLPTSSIVSILDLNMFMDSRDAMS